MLTFGRLLRHFLFVPLAFVLGLVVLIASPSIVIILALLAYWAAVGSWMMSYIGTAESRVAEGIPVQLHFLKKKHWYGTSNALEFTPYYHCFNPECSYYFGKSELKTKDMAPIASYLVSKGRCSYCHQKYSNETFKLEVKGLYLGLLVTPRWYKLVTQNFVEDVSDSVR
jgi:hypothetical protein